MLESSLLKDYTLVVFDLDDTLYQETDYLFSAYQEIEKYISKIIGIPYGEVSGLLQTTFESKGRDGLFDFFLDHFNIKDTGIKAEMLNILRTNNCNISLFPEAGRMINELHEAGKDLAILTNGNIIQQKNKVKCLGICDLYPFVDVVYAAEVGAKPQPTGLYHISRKHDCPLNKMAFIGDANVDEETARNAGVDYYYIK